ncbi:hypothetical protein EV126DRAFT_122305 [Verticillium dahliae]|nr:hypothetical protein EV126DRAFT_122305 [Verticillium dahliae]
MQVAKVPKECSSSVLLFFLQFLPFHTIEGVRVSISKLCRQFRAYKFFNARRGSYFIPQHCEGIVTRQDKSRWQCSSTSMMQTCYQLVCFGLACCTQHCLRSCHYHMPRITDLNTAALKG